MKLSTPDLELLITNLKAFIVKVEEDKENQEYDMDDHYSCVYAKTMKEIWHPDDISQMLVGKDCFTNCHLVSKHIESKLYIKANNLFCGDYFSCDEYGYRRVTKQQWLEVANKVVLKLEKKLWKRKVKESKWLEDGGVENTVSLSKNITPLPLSRESNGVEVVTVGFFR